MEFMSSCLEQVNVARIFKLLRLLLWRKN